MKKINVLLLGLFIALNMQAQEMKVVASANKSFGDITAINISAEFCKVDVKIGENNAVVGELKAAKELEGYLIDCSEETGVLTVKVQKPASGWTSHSGFVNVTVKPGTKVNIQTTSGYITLNDLNGNDVSAQSKSGKINAANLNGTVSLKSVSGSIKAENLKGQINLKSKGGQQVVRNIDGALSLYTSGGSMLVENLKGSLKTESTDGTQTLKEIDGDIYLKTKSGAMKLSNAQGTVGSLAVSGTLNLFDVTAKMNLVATKGAIIGTRVKLTESSTFNTTEGKIKLKFVNTKEELSFACESEHAYIVAFGKSKKKKLKVSGGPIMVTSVSTTGAQSYY